MPVLQRGNAALRVGVGSREVAGHPQLVPSSLRLLKGLCSVQHIRNFAAHSLLQALSETVALEHLACLSYWARLIDRASVWCALATQP